MKSAALQPRLRARLPELLEAVRDGLRVDTSVADPAACRRFCETLRARIESFGGTAALYEAGEMPAVLGRLDVGARRTLLLYKNYDCVPADPTRWSTPPFAAARLDLDGPGDSIVGRGAAEPKGPLLAALETVAAIRASGDDLPVNLLFLFTGDEQFGSPTLAAAAAERRDQLAAAEAVLVPKFSQSYSGVPVIPLGFKGLLVLELICAGGRWGGPSRQAMHSGNAAWIASPVWRLVQALATLVTEEEEVAVEGFFDEVVHAIPPTPRGGALASEMVEYLRDHHVVCFKQDLPDGALFRRYLLSPTFNISNLLVRPSTPWSDLALPSEARARIDVRLVPEMDPDRTLGRIRDHLAVMGYRDIETIPHMAYRPWRTEEDDPLVETWKSVYRSFGFEPEVHPSTGTSLRLSVFDRLGLPAVVGGLGCGGRAYHENEYATVAGVRSFVESFAEFLCRFGEGGGPGP